MFDNYKKPLIFDIDLQLFADGENGEESTPLPSYNSIDEDIRNLINEPVTESATEPTQELPTEQSAPATEQSVESGTEQPTEQPTEQQPTAPTDQIPNPVQNDIINNPIVQELIKQNQILQQTMQQQSQLMQEYLQKSMLNNSQQPSPEPIKTPEEIEAEKEVLMDRFYKNPMEVLNEFTKKATEPLEKELRRFREKEEWQTAINDIAANKEAFPEFENIRERMGEILKERPYLLQSGDKAKALSDAYAIAIAERGFTQPTAQTQQLAPAQATQQIAQPVNTAEMMKSPEFIKQIISNPEIMKMIAAEQAKQIRAQSQQVPPMSPSSGVANVAPFIKNKPTNYNELEEDIKNSIRSGTL
jgi:hypothetical protein